MLLAPRLPSLRETNVPAALVLLLVSDASVVVGAKTEFEVWACATRPRIRAATAARANRRTSPPGRGRSAELQARPRASAALRYRYLAAQNGPTRLHSGVVASGGNVTFANYSTYTGLQR